MKRYLIVFIIFFVATSSFAQFLDKQLEGSTEESLNHFSVGITKTMFDSAVETKISSLEYSRRIALRIQISSYLSQRYQHKFYLHELLVGGIYNFSSKNDLLSSWYSGLRAGVLRAENASERKNDIVYHFFGGKRFNVYKNISWNPQIMFKYQTQNKNRSEFEFTPWQLTWSF